MQNSEQDRQDHSANPVMEDSAAMTIEFLRARLLSERSVSKSARQRADELAKRVAELEEQLQIVSLQRKKAERATADVLAILENNGISDVSEAFDSSSDQETPCEYKVGNNATKEEESSINSKVKKSESEEFSGSDADFSSVAGRNLSWKSCKDTHHSIGKYKDNSFRRRSSFASVGSSSPKHRQGKSCRQIRRRESRSVAEEFKTGPVKVDSQEKGVGSSSKVLIDDGGSEILRGGAEIQEKEAAPERALSLENERSVSCNDFDFNSYGRDKDMEKALERQAQLIDRYEAMEKAQREWEEKFRENNNCTPDSCDPGNHSDVTEERDDTKAQAPHHNGTICSQPHEAKLEVEDVFVSKELFKTEPNDFPVSSLVDSQSFKDQKCWNTATSKSQAQDFPFPVAKEKQNQQSLVDNYSPLAHSSRNHLQAHASHDDPGNMFATNVFSSNPGSNISKAETSGSQNGSYALVLHKNSEDLGGVLEALKQARASLQQKINRLPLIEAGSIGKAIEPSFPSMKTGERVEIPVGCAGLFRLPTDFSVEAGSHANFLTSSSRLSLGNYHPTTVGEAAPSDHFISSPFMEARSSSAIDYRFLTSQYMESGSRNATQKPYFDPSLDTGLPSFSRYTYPTRSSYPDHPTYPSYPDLMPRMPAKEEFSRTFPSRSSVTPSSDHFSFYDDHQRPNMYR